MSPVSPSKFARALVKVVDTSRVSFVRLYGPRVKEGPSYTDAREDRQRAPYPKIIIDRTWTSVTPSICYLKVLRPVRTPVQGTEEGGGRHTILVQRLKCVTHV